MNLTELAKSPLAFDTELARLHERHATLNAQHVDNMAAIHRLVGDRKSYRGRSLVWGRTTADVLDEAQARADQGSVQAQTMLDRRDSLSAEIHELIDTIQAMDLAYTGWTRFFPSVTKSQPHIHRSLTCRTLHPTTVMTWAPGLSGHTDAEAVAELDEALCSVCFPDAPVALHNYVSRKSQAEQAARDEAAVARMAAKAAKTLTTAEQFRTEGRFGEKVTTVAKCKELVRKAIELEVEHEYWTQVAAGTRSAPQGWTPELLARRVSNGADSLSEAQRDAGRAAAVLTAREAENTGWGASAAEITKMQQAKYRSARKDWM